MGFLKNITHKVNHSVKHFGKTLHHQASRAIHLGTQIDKGIGKSIHFLENSYSTGKKGLIKQAGKIGLGQEARLLTRSIEASPFAGMATGALSSVKNARGVAQDYLALARTQNNKVQQLVNS